MARQQTHPSPVAAATPAKPPRHKPPALVPGLPYTRRALLTSVAVHLELALALFIASRAILPTHPHLLPLAVVLPPAVSLALHNVLRHSALVRYDVALRRALHGPHARRPGAAATPPVAGCAKCGLPRPQRTHHCRECARCTGRMSHHCGVLGVCIGAHNYKPFVQLISLSALGTGLLAWYAADPAGVVQLLRHYARFEFPPWRLLLWLQAVYVHTVVAVALVAFAALHLRLVALNVTALEAWTRDDEWAAVATPRFLRRSPRRAPYDAGWRHNVQEVFGTGFAALSPVVDVERAVAIALERRAATA